MSAINNNLALAANSVATALAPGSSSSSGPSGVFGAKAAANAQPAATGAASSSSSTTSTSSANSEITSSDFLSLLVTELQNQDPTQPTDPDQYITQMVGVNSLQQLISINQELS